MFERFTDRARVVLREAQAESIEGGHGFIGTEHVLIGMIRQGDGVAGRVLAEHGIALEAVREKVAAEISQYVRPDRIDRASALATIGIDFEAVRTAVEATFGQGSLPDPATQPSFTPKGKRCLELAFDASLRWRDYFIGTEHLLAGVVKLEDGVAASVLRDLGADLEELSSAAKRMANPERWRADQAYQRYIDLVSEVWMLPDGPAKEELQGRLQGFTVMAEEHRATRAAAEVAAAGLEELNAGLEEALAGLS